MNIRPDHITVCVCTFRRPALLARTLDGLASQTTGGQFSYSIVVADNDADRSAEAAVYEFQIRAGTAVSYCIEARQNIALARNKALSQADGEWIAFLDDDEVPSQEWLLRLDAARRRLGCDGVLGPVVPYFDSAPPPWVIKGKFFDRPSHATGYELRWAECRTGNVLFRRDMLDSIEEPFRSHFNTAGEDMDFFRRMIDRGRVFRWCGEAPVYELVPAARCTRSFLLKRALLRGSNFPKHPADRLKNLAKSVVAVPAYTLALPVLAAFGQHIFLRYLIKLLDHAARLLAFSGVLLVKERET
jgi:succinoglycan biosynthesis protein ExoM